MAADAYGYLARLQDEAAKRARLKAVKYTANTHKTNPFVNGSLTDQSRFAAMSPELAQFFKAEAEPVKLPFGVNGNMTERGQITRNPKLKAIADRADEIVALWKEAERRKLMAAKAEAEKQLKALEAK